MERDKPAISLKAMRMFDNLSGKPPKLRFWGIRTPRVPKGKTRIHLTAVPFHKDHRLAELATVAVVEGKPLLALVIQGDPDENLEAMVEKFGRRIGKWEVNPYNNVLVTTFHPKCSITNNLTNAPPKFRALIKHIEKHYIPYDEFPRWGRANGLIQEREADHCREWVGQWDQSHVSVKRRTCHEKYRRKSGSQKFQKTRRG